MAQDVRLFYARDPQIEWDRLETAYSRFELLTTIHKIGKYFPTRGKVLDSGGGPGRYTIELLKRGYQATLFDLTPELLEIAEKKIASNGLKADRIIAGDARQIGIFEENFFDAGLLMGPLYHLSDESDREAALANFFRALKPGAKAIIAYLNAWGLIQTGMIDFPSKYEDSRFLHSMLDEGGIGIWYWSNPNRAGAEIARAGFKMESYAGAEGCAGGAHTFVEQLAAANRIAYEHLSQLVIETSELPPFRDLSNHLHFVVSKPIT